MNDPVTPTSLEVPPLAEITHGGPVEVTPLESATRVVEGFLTLEATNAEAGNSVKLSNEQSRLYDAASGYLTEVFDLNTELIQAARADEGDAKAPGRDAGA